MGVAVELGVGQQVAPEADSAPVHRRAPPLALAVEQEGAKLAHVRRLHQLQQQPRVRLKRRGKLRGGGGGSNGGQTGVKWRSNGYLHQPQQQPRVRLKRRGKLREGE